MTNRIQQHQLFLQLHREPKVQHFSKCRLTTKHIVSLAKLTQKVLMMRISKHLRSLYPDLPYDEFEGLVEEGLQLKKKNIAAADFPSIATRPLMVQLIFQIALHRNIELTSAFIHSFNGELLIPLFVLSRAAIETGSLIYDIRDRIERVVLTQDKTIMFELGQHLSKVFLGTKTNTWVGNPEKYPSPNVLTIIDRLSKKAVPELRSHYDAISEFVHPNYAGMASVYSENDTNNMTSRLIDPPFHERSELIGIPFAAAAFGTIMIIDSIKYYEKVLDSFVQLCEQEIQDDGS